MKILTVFLGEEEEENIGFTLNYIASKIKKGVSGNKRFPTKWKIEEKTDSHTIFVLFETDLHKSKASRVFLGAYESWDVALETAQKNNCIRTDCQIDIIPTELNKFKEI
jgi:hypothetical protein